MKRVSMLLKRIVNNEYIYSVVAKVLGVGIALLLSVVTARFFGSELKGIQAIIQNDVSLYSVLLGLGIYQAYPFYRKKEPQIMPVFINNITTMFLGYEILAAVIFIVMYLNNINVYLAVAILLMPVEVFIKQLNYVVLIEHPKRRNTASLIISMSEILIVLVMWLFFDATVSSIILYYCIAEITNLVLSFINLRYNPFEIRLNASRLWEFAKFGFIPMLTFLCMTINYKIDIQMLKRFDCVSYADIGIYSIGVTLAEKIWLIPDAIKDILLSKLVKGKGKQEVSKIIRINLIICIFAIILLVLVGKPVIVFLYGAEFEQAYFVMILMFLGILGMIFYKMIYSYNISRGKRVVNLIFLGTAALVNIVGNAILIPKMGIWGAGITSICSYNVCGACFLVYFHKISEIPYKEILIIQKEDISEIVTFLGLNRK